MTPDHEQLIESTLQLAYARTGEWMKNLAIPLGKNPPIYTRGMMWSSPLGQDLQAIANYVEGYPAEEIIEIISRATRILFGQTLSSTDIRLPHHFHKTPLGQLLYDAYARYYPADAWMRTSEVQKLFEVKRQTVYDWAEEGKLVAYHVKGHRYFCAGMLNVFMGDGWHKSGASSRHQNNTSSVLEFYYRFILSLSNVTLFSLKEILNGPKAA